MRGVGEGLSRSFLLTGHDEPASLTQCKTRLYNLHCEFGPQASRRGPENCISHFGFVSVKSEQLAEKPFRGCKGGLFNRLYYLTTNAHIHRLCINTIKMARALIGLRDTEFESAVRLASGSNGLGLEV